jgi:hypothetical protein
VIVDLAIGHGLARRRQPRAEHQVLEQGERVGSPRLLAQHVLDELEGRRFVVLAA